MIVYVLRAGVKAIISGGSSRQITNSAPLTLDASASYDIDYPSGKSLNFTWTCSLIYPIYGSSCGIDSILSNVISSNLDFQAGKLLPSRTYNFSVIVYGYDGTSASASVSVAVIAEPVPATNFASLSDKYNAGERTVLTAYVNATSPVVASWSCPSCGLNLSYITNTPLTLYFDSGFDIRVQLSIASNTLTPGATYTFIITTFFVDTSLTASGQASANVVVNQPPSGGSLTVSPTKGYVLSTLFILNTFNWIDDISDYPLQYVLVYYTFDVNVLHSIKSLSQLSYISTYLGQGLESMSYLVTCVAYAQDIYGANDDVSYEVNVYPNLNPQSLQSSLNEKLQHASSSLDTDLTSAVINTVATSINAANCSLAPNCTVLHRNPCSSVPHTCGPCLDGYLGVIGSFNSYCLLESHLSNIGGSCRQNSNCISNFCNKGLCEVSPKSCPSNCSAHGKCLYFDSNGYPTSFCDSNSLFCKARCSCHQGWYGSSCSLASTDYETVVSIRESMCSSYYESAFFQVGFICNLCI